MVGFHNFCACYHFSMQYKAETRQRTPQLMGGLKYIKLIAWCNLHISMFIEKLHFAQYALRRTILGSVFILLAGLSLRAAGVQGQVADENGKPLPYASIFVRETGSGAVSNQQGIYELRLNPGDYTLVFQFMGYQTEERKVQITYDWIVLDVRGSAP